jgi:hypothetical protein
MNWLHGSIYIIVFTQYIIYIIHLQLEAMCNIIVSTIGLSLRLTLHFEVPPHNLCSSTITRINLPYLLIQALLCSCKECSSLAGVS